MTLQKSILVVLAEIRKQQKHEFHSYFVCFSLLLWPVLGFFEVFYTYKPFETVGMPGIGCSKALLTFLGTGAMAHTCFWSVVQNAWSMAWEERKGGTLELTFLSPANRLAMSYGRALGALFQEVWMFLCFCVIILIYSDALRLDNLLLLPLVFLLLVVSSTVWGGLMNTLLMFSRDASIVMDFLDTPMTLFSGTRIPVHCFPLWARFIALLFPLTYCIDIIRFVFHIQKGENCWIYSLLGLMVYLILMVLMTMLLIRKVEQHNRETGELQFY